MKRHNLITVALCLCVLMAFSNAWANHQAKARNYTTELVPPLPVENEVVPNEVAPTYNLTTQPGLEPIPGEGLNTETGGGNPHISPCPKIGPLFPIEIQLRIMLMRVSW